MLIFSVQLSDSVTHIYILFHILFYYASSQNTEYSSLCYMIGTCWLPSLCLLIVCLCWSQIFIPPLYSFLNLGPHATSVMETSVQLFPILPPSLPSRSLRMLSGLHGWVPRPVGNPGGRSEERGARGQGISALAPAGRSLLAGHGLWLKLAVSRQECIHPLSSEWALPSSSSGG